MIAKVALDKTIPVARDTIERMKIELEAARIKLAKQREEIQNAGIHQAEPMDAQNVLKVKQEKDELETSIKYLSTLIERGQFVFIDEMTIDTERVGIGMDLRLLDTGSGTELMITFLGPLDVDTESDIYNFDPDKVPMAKAAEGLCIGDQFECNGAEYKILDISRWD